MTEKPKRPYTRTLKTYVVSEDGGEDRLVRAYTPGAALQHCMPLLKVRLASQDDIIELMAAGVPVSTVDGIHEPVWAADELSADEAAPGLTD